MNDEDFTISEHVVLCPRCSKMHVFDIEKIMADPDYYLADKMSCDAYPRGIPGEICYRGGECEHYNSLE